GVVGGDAAGHDEDAGADDRPDAERRQPDRAEDAAQPALVLVHLAVELLEGFRREQALEEHMNDPDFGEPRRGGLAERSAGLSRAPLRVAANRVCRSSTENTPESRSGPVAVP